MEGRTYIIYIFISLILPDRDLSTNVVIATYISLFSKWKLSKSTKASLKYEVILSYISKDLKCSARQLFLASNPDPSCCILNLISAYGINNCQSWAGLEEDEHRPRSPNVFTVSTRGLGGAHVLITSFVFQSGHYSVKLAGIRKLLTIWFEKSNSCFHTIKKHTCYPSTALF